MPVRTVPKNYRSLTGLVPNTRTQSMTAFESSLERDFLLLRQQGWRFHVVTERHVRTPYLENVKFLRPYRTLPGNDAYRTQLLSTLATLEATDPASLLAAVCQDRWQQAQLLPMLWQLVATRQIGADLSQPLTMQSCLWLQKP